jgi:hypothetical protein
LRVSVVGLKSALPLLVAAVGANDADDALAPDDLAVFAKLFDGCADFHFLNGSKSSF